MIVCATELYSLERSPQSGKPCTGCSYIVLRYRSIGQVRLGSLLDIITAASSFVSDQNSTAPNMAGGILLPLVLLPTSVTPLRLDNTQAVQLHQTAPARH